MGALVKSGSWQQLQSIPQYRNRCMHQDFAYYFNTAYHLPNSFTSLCLPTMITYSHFNEFTNLKVLEIKNVDNIGTMIDCDKTNEALAIFGIPRCRLHI
jgi:hypothetical protein